MHRAILLVHRPMSSFTIVDPLRAAKWMTNCQPLALCSGIGFPHPTAVQHVLQAPFG